MSNQRTNFTTKEKYFHKTSSLLIILTICMLAISQRAN